MDILSGMRQKIKLSTTRIIFPEGEDERIILAAERISQLQIACPILLGRESEIRKIANLSRLDFQGIQVIDSLPFPRMDLYIETLSKEKGLSFGVARRLLSKPVYVGAMIVKMDDADAMVAGIATETEEVILSSQLIVGLRKGISIPSSFFVMDIPGYSGAEGSLLIFADGGSNPSPTPEELADIAITTANSARKLLGWEPKVALLSFSTKGSAVNPQVDRVIEALQIIQKREPDLLVDGELQVDAAIVPEVAKRKIINPSAVAGHANILIFPDLDAGNIGYKLVQRLAKAKAYGPLLQGFNKPVSDLSRGSTVDDIIGVATIKTLEAQSLDPV